MLIVFGSINADLLFAVDALPTPGQTLLASGLSLQPGGKGANQAAAAARDGEPVRLVGAVGADPMADLALSLLRTLPIDLSMVATAQAPTGCACIATDAAGRNQIVVAPGANALARQANIELSAGDLVVTQMECDPAETAALIRRAHAVGARTLHNHAPASPLDPAALALIDVLVVNEDEAAWLAETHAPAPHTVLVRTLGGRGVEWSGGKGRGALPAHRITPVDTTAAGDCFTGVLAAALHRGDDLPAAMFRANAAAACACRTPGSQRSVPTTAEIDAEIDQHRRAGPLTSGP